MDENSVISRVMEYVRENFLYARPDLRLERDTDLLEEGIIDSMGIVELVGFLEGEFDLSLSDDEITDENLGSPGAIGRFVAAKRSRGGATRTSA